ncbi:MAG: multiheme c-type cytochrome, partial [bacterium]
WYGSGHSKISPEQAAKKKKLERLVSSDTFPDNLKSVAVGCFECHGLNRLAHSDNFDHQNFKINVIVSPDDCGVCHPVEASQYSNSKKANALDILRKNPVYDMLIEAAVSIKEINSSGNKTVKSTEHTRNQTCYACHGTEVKVMGRQTISTEIGEMSVPVLTNWPNQGVGRINPDKSKGSCTSCHPRHGFNIEIARKPHTCSQCHLEPDVPAWNVYKESKHGNIFSSLGSQWNWKSVPWKLGKDFTAPSCAVCHNSLITTPAGDDIIINRSHDFGQRLWVRLLGLIYSHPQPKNGRTYEIRNSASLSLPTSFNGEIAGNYLISKLEEMDRINSVKKLCTSCHGTFWTNQHFSSLDKTIRETDRMVMSSTNLIIDAWNKNILDRINPFDEVAEQQWIIQWLFYANSIRYAAAMGGPDYAAFKNGWWSLNANLLEIQRSLKLK